MLVPHTAGASDTRRSLNAGLHRLHLGHDTLCVHAGALRRPDGDGAALLLGGHGAGKTLVTAALALREWRVLAGDVALVDVAASGQASVRGGTGAFLARRGPLRRWFPDIGVGDGADTGKVDLRSRFAHETPVVPCAVSVVAVVDVDGDPRTGDGTVGLLDQHTAATQWLRSSAHLLDRVMEDEDAVLREVEDAAAIRHRLALVRSLATAMPVHTVRGVPRTIAEHIDALAGGERPS
ncbi:hypothetical protein BJF83_20265 [Nocardiopsis sp. CNR-923]|nr:hypothetical protein BJF83_20265 [Nocardiopsis sp. CNR-923]